MYLQARVGDMSGQEKQVRERGQGRNKINVCTSLPVSTRTAFERADGQACRRTARRLASKIIDPPTCHITTSNKDGMFSASLFDTATRDLSTSHLVAECNQCIWGFSSGLTLRACTPFLDHSLQTFPEYSRISFRNGLASSGHFQLHLSTLTLQ